MFLDSLHFWASVALACAFALFVEGVLLVRILLLTHQIWKKYFLAMIPVLVSMWSFIVTQNALSIHIFFPDTHFTAEAYRTLMASIQQAIQVCQFQAGITIAVFIAMLFVEKALPHVDRSPVWAMRKSSSLY